MIHQASLGPALTECANRIKNASAAVSVKADIQAFIAEKRTGAVKPPLAQYEPYDTTVSALAMPLYTTVILYIYFSY
jgi:hypothetical protein